MLDSESGKDVLSAIQRDSRFHIVAPLAARELLPTRALTTWSETISGAPRDGTPVLVIADSFSAEFALRKQLKAANVPNVGLFASVAPAAVAAQDWGMLFRPGDTLDRPGSTPDFRYILFCPPRVGSGLLCSTLRDCGLGAPIEHVRGASAVARAAGMPQPAFVMALEPYASKNRVFGTKLLIHAFARGGGTGALSGLEPWRNTLRILSERGYKYFSLTRDPIDSAVSRTLAETTRIWHVSGEELERAQSTQASVELDEALLWGYLTRRIAQDLFLEEVLPLPADQVFQYDDLIADPKAVAATVARVLGAPFTPPREEGPLPARLSKGNRVYDEWRLRAAELVLKSREETEDTILDSLSDITHIPADELRTWDNVERRIESLIDNAGRRLS